MPNNDHISPENSSMKLGLSGLHCRGCARRVENSLEALPQVSRAVVSVDLLNCEVEFSRDSQDAAVLLSTIEGLGFSASISG